jgi:hypothetical protein
VATLDELAREMLTAAAETDMNTEDERHAAEQRAALMLSAGLARLAELMRLFNISKYDLARLADKIRKEYQ